MHAHRAQVVVKLEGGYWLRVRVEDSEAPLERMLPVLAHLMRGPQSDTISREQPQSAAISHLMMDAIRHHQRIAAHFQTAPYRPSPVHICLLDLAISRNQWPSITIHHHPSPSITIHHHQGHLCLLDLGHFHTVDVGSHHAGDRIDDARDRMPARGLAPD